MNLRAEFVNWKERNNIEQKSKKKASSTPTITWTAAQSVFGDRVKIKLKSIQAESEAEWVKELI